MGAPYQANPDHHTIELRSKMQNLIVAKECTWISSKAAHRHPCDQSITPIGKPKTPFSSRGVTTQPWRYLVARPLPKDQVLGIGPWLHAAAALRLVSRAVRSLPQRAMGTPDMWHVPDRINGASIKNCVHGMRLHASATSRPFWVMKIVMPPHVVHGAERPPDPGPAPSQRQPRESTMREAQPETAMRPGRFGLTSRCLGSRIRTPARGLHPLSCAILPFPGW